MFAKSGPFRATKFASLSIIFLSSVSANEFNQKLLIYLDDITLATYLPVLLVLTFLSSDQVRIKTLD
jgi:hypothetical protein